MSFNRLHVPLLLSAVVLAASASADAAQLSAEKEQELRTRSIALYQQGRELANRGRFQEAAQLLEENLKLAQQIFPADKYPQGHPDLATAIAGLGGVLHMGGQYARAQAYYQ